MTADEKLQKLKELIDEAGYSFYEDEYLLGLIKLEANIAVIAQQLLIQKAALPEIRLGDINIKPPSDYFYRIASSLRGKYINEKGELVERSSKDKVMQRYDGRS